jgi:hypothetical protein
MEAIPKRRPGRPAKSPTGPKRANLKLRLNDITRDAIERSARENQRSLSEETEIRLIYTLWSEAQIGMTFDFAYGFEGAGAALLLGRLIKEVIAELRLNHVTADRRSGPWLNNPDAVAQVVAAIQETLKIIRPPGGSDSPEPGRTVARFLLASLVDPDAPREVSEWADPIRERLGPDALERIRKALADG